MTLTQDSELDHDYFNELANGHNAILRPYPLLHDNSYNIFLKG
jgi:hypothetical protein